MKISQLCNRCKGASTSGLEREEDKEQMGCWAPPLQNEGPHDLQESRKKGNYEVHHVGKHEPSILTLGL